MKAIRSGLRGRDDGAAAIEFALLFPIFVMIVFGLMSAGFAFSRQLNITNAAREASRYGSTLTVKAAGGTTDDWVDKVYAAAADAAGTDFLNGYSKLCVALVQTSGSEHEIGTDNATSGTRAAGDCTVGTGMSVRTGLDPPYTEVVFTRTSDFNYIVADPTVTLDSVSVTPYEDS